jgi:hypothetical protein
VLKDSFVLDCGSAGPRPYGTPRRGRQPAPKLGVTSAGLKLGWARSIAGGASFFPGCPYGSFFTKGHIAR